MKIFKSADYSKWIEFQSNKIKRQVEARLLRIEQQNYFGNHKHLIDKLWELKFNNGNRIYFTLKMIEGKAMFLILGGNKNGQEKDIFKAKKIAQKIHQET